MVPPLNPQNCTLVLCYVLTLISQSKGSSISMEWYKFQNMTLRLDCVSIPIFYGAVTNTLCGILAISETPYDYAFYPTQESCEVCRHPNSDMDQNLYIEEYQFYGPVWRMEGKRHLYFFQHGPLTRYTKLWVAHVPGMSGTFYPPPTAKEAAS